MEGFALAKASFAYSSSHGVAYAPVFHLDGKVADIDADNFTQSLCLAALKADSEKAYAIE
jgi:hypothetical protein